MSAGAEERFDVQVFSVPNGALATEWGTAGYHALGMSLDGARAACREIRGVGGVAIVVPLRYRAARVGVEEAREIAKANVHARVTAEPSRYGLLESAGEDALTCHFYLDDLVAQSAGVAPGRITVLVDRLDGHIWTADEQWEFAALNGWGG